MKILRLTARGLIVPISFQVPRKAAVFHADLYPDAYAGVPSLSADEWFKGENKDPVLKSLDPANAAAAPQKKLVKSSAELQLELDAANKMIAEQASEIEALKAQLAALKA